MTYRPPTIDVFVETLLPGSVEGLSSATVCGSFTVHALSRPGDRLTVDHQEAIFAALVPVTTSSFGADMTGYWKDRRHQGYFERLHEFVIVGDAEGRMVGWTGFSILETAAFVNCYIDSSGLVPGLQSKGLMKEVMRSRLRGPFLVPYASHDRLYLSARSESPIFYRLMLGITEGGSLYPQSHRPVPADVLECADHLAAWLGQSDFREEDSLILRNAYGALDELYGELPLTGQAELDSLFRDRIGPLDAYLLIGRMHLDQNLASPTPGNVS